MSIEKRTKWVYFIGIAGVIAAIAGVGLIATSRRAAADREGKERSDEIAKGPRVRVARAQLSPPMRKLELQGEARPFASATLYAKVSGYIKEVRVDKGDTVKPNQVMAVIEAPEIDRQYEAAVADASYKKANARRAAELAKPGVVSAAEAETQVGVAEVANAQVATLAQQKSYEVLRAPFAGTVTARYADPGALVQAATGAQTGALPLVTISTPERLRVYVYVPQRDATFVKVGDRAQVTMPDRADVQIEGRVTRRTDELDSRTRMMLVEVDLDNRDGKIVPGSFVTVTLTFATPPEIFVPVEALVLNGAKASVFVLDGEKVHARPVVVSDNDGTIARLARGLRSGELVALNLGDNVADGARVQPMTPPPSGGRDAAGK
ncbi:MAG TPA: efflux RND transporter periplasmic adaptor subunit [Polyangia bacterium]|jgi:RND family efflux transporter MFP subunit|nr:efflux RND transporter periplasmic adaptor subunit [Polyangia bacterium]